MLMTQRLSMTQHGDQPVDVTCMVSDSTPIILGMLGPQMSVSMMPMVRSGSVAKACDSSAVRLDLHTPPFPLRTRILCLIPASRAVMASRSGSGPFGGEAQMEALGQPAQASALPACSDSGPGQASGSGATRCGLVLCGFAFLSSFGSGAFCVGALFL